MALAHLVLSLSPFGCGFSNGDAAERRRALGLRIKGGVSLGGKVTGGVGELGSRSSRREVKAWARLKTMEAPMAEGVQKIGSFVEIPVTCYQILGVPEKAEKDEVVKVAMELKSSGIDDEYTSDVIVSRQDLLVDVRDKILFEPEYAGNLKEKIQPRSSLRIPWPWIPGALCLLQEVGEEKLVLAIGRAALQMPDAKPYIHDLLLSMALAECSIAKAYFEKNKVSEGFEALARAQYLLRSNISLGQMPLLSQIEESLEELAPACTLEILGLPPTPDNAERRRGAISALCELLRQGLDVETSCRVQDWPCFLSQAMRKLMAIEIVDLISWDALAVTRKNKKSLEAQNQKVIIDFDCFYLAMIAHIALGFSTRQTDMVSKAKTICECLMASEGVDLKFEEAFCSLLLGQGSEEAAVEKLRQLEVNGSSTLRKYESKAPSKETRSKATTNQLLANFCVGPKRILRMSKPHLGPSKPGPSFGRRSLSVGSSEIRSSSDQHRINSTHLGEAVTRLTPVNLQSQPSFDTNSMSGSSSQLQRNLGLDRTKIWEDWSMTSDLAGKISHALVVGCFVFSTFKLFSMQFGNNKAMHKWLTYQSKVSSASVQTMDSSPGSKITSFADRSILDPLGKLFVVFRQKLMCRTSAATARDAWPTDDLTSAISGTLLHARQMPFEEAEILVKQWQEIKAEVLGPNHQIDMLSEILDGSMLSKWQDLAVSAKATSCFWRFVLLQLSILRADIGWDEDGNEVAGIEALLEEAAELVDDSQPRKPSYYSKYKVQYILRRQDDGSWRFSRGGIQNPV